MTRKDEGRRHGQILEGHDLAEDSATESQANLEVTNQGTLRLLNENDDCETWSNLQLV